MEILIDSNIILDIVKYPDKSFSVFEDLRGFGNLAGLMSDSYLRIYVRVLTEDPNWSSETLRGGTKRSPLPDFFIGARGSKRNPSDDTGCFAVPRLFSRITDNFT